MRYRILDSNGDMTFGKNFQNITYGIYAVRQAIQTRLNLLYQEWFEDKEDGTKLFEYVLGQRGIETGLLVADSTIKERILGTTGVVSISDFQREFNSETREYNFTCTVNTIYGSTEIEG